MINTRVLHSPNNKYEKEHHLVEHCPNQSEIVNDVNKCL